MGGWWQQTGGCGARRAARKMPNLEDFPLRISVSLCPLSQALLYSIAYSTVVPLLRRRADEAVLTRLGFAGMALGCGVCGVANSAPVFFLAVAPMVIGAAVVRSPRERERGGG